MFSILASVVSSVPWLALSPPFNYACEKLCALARLLDTKLGQSYRTTKFFFSKIVNYVVLRRPN